MRPLFYWCFLFIRTDFGYADRVVNQTTFHRSMLCLAVILGLIVAASHARAGGSGLNVVVVVNQASTNSVQLGNYYCERRHVPPENVLRINWSGSNIEWDTGSFTNTLLNPLLTVLSSRGLTNQIDYVVLSMDIPYRTSVGGQGGNSTTAMLFYDFKSDTRPPCSLATNSFNSYSGTEDMFHFTKPATATSFSFLATMITADTLAQAKQLVDSGVNSDATFPTNSVLLAKTSDSARNVRFEEFDNAILNTRVRGNYAMSSTFSDTVAGYSNLLGLETGLAAFAISSNTFVPGAMADSLTSYAGAIFENTGQTTLLAFTQAGAAGSYGTVIEPCNYLVKFPSALNYFYQARGFSLAECYYQSLTNPYQGLLVGEPLAAPFRTNGSLTWNNLTNNATLSGTTNLSLQMNAAGVDRPIQQLDLFVDGKFLQTITNIAPRQNNNVTVTLNGFARTYTVPASASIKSIATGLASSLNNFSYQNQTKVTATAHGDRVELQSTDLSKTGAQLSAAVTNAIGSATALTALVTARRTNFADTTAAGLRSYAISGLPTVNSTLQLTVTKTNGSAISVTTTNPVGNTTLSIHVQQFWNDIVSTPALQGADGLVPSDFLVGGSGTTYFLLVPRSPGRLPAEIQANITTSAGISVTPSGTATLTENLGDLQPRNHLYVGAGTTNQTVTFALNTSSLADGFHELTAVAYEGTSVRAQTHATVPVRVQNSSLSGALSLMNADTTTAVESTLAVQVVANQTNIALIELFSTGGLLASVSNQSNASFNVSASALGLGQHPFYAIITTTGGQKYRTANFTTRLVGYEDAIPLRILGPQPIQLTWPGVAGRGYDVLAAAQMTNAFTVRTSVTASNSVSTSWNDSSLTTNDLKLFYRVRVSP